MVLAVCPQNAEDLITVDHECSAMVPDDLCYYGDALPGWTVGGEVYYIKCDLLCEKGPFGIFHQY